MLILITAPQAPFEESATTEASRRCPLTGFLREFRVMFWGHVLEVFANGICVLAVQNTTPEMLRIGEILSDVCLPMYQRFHSPFFDDFYEEFICFFTKKSLKKGDPGWNSTPTVTRFRTGHLAEVVALSSNGDCGATPLSVCLVATLVTIT